MSPRAEVQETARAYWRAKGVRAARRGFALTTELTGHRAIDPLIREGFAAEKAQTTAETQSNRTTGTDNATA